MIKPTYLGDGVYAEDEGHQIKLMANSHTSPTDIIYLDPSTMRALVDYQKQIDNRYIEIKQGEKNEIIII